MKTMLMVACVELSIWTAQAVPVAAPILVSVNKANESKQAETELNQQVKDQLFNLDLLMKQYQTAYDRIVRSPGNHEEIEHDFQYFYQALQVNGSSKVKEENQEALGLKRKYARKHRDRAITEQKRQHELVLSMKKELTSFRQAHMSLKKKYAKSGDSNSVDELGRLEKAIVAAGELLKTREEQNLQAVSYYRQCLEDVKTA